MRTRPPLGYVLLALFALTAACASDPDSIDAGLDGSLDAKPSDAKSDALTDGGPKDGANDVGSEDASFPSDAALPCNGSTTGQCGPGFYCDAPGCGLGKCKAAPAESSALDAICGCDGITYWNTTIAQTHGVTPSTKGECSVGKLCGGLTNIQCPAGAKCNFKLASQGACASSDPTGVCWGVPAQCSVVVGPKTHQCGAGKCTDQCTLIKQGVTYYDDNTCP